MSTDVFAREISVMYASHRMRRSDRPEGRVGQVYCKLRWIRVRSKILKVYFFVCSIIYPLKGLVIRTVIRKQKTLMLKKSLSNCFCFQNENNLHRCILCMLHSHAMFTKLHISDYIINKMDDVHIVFQLLASSS